MINRLLKYILNAVDSHLLETLDTIEHKFKVLTADQTNAATNLQAITSIVEDHSKLLSDLNNRVEASANEKEARKSSDIPWVDVSSSTYDPEKGLCVGIDWNHAFIKYLRDSGFTGKDDDALVRKWLEMLSADMSTYMNNAAIESSDFHQGSEFAL